MGNVYTNSYIIQVVEIVVNGAHVKLSQNTKFKYSTKGHLIEDIESPRRLKKKELAMSQKIQT